MSEKIYKHKYACYGCEEIKDEPGCTQTFKACFNDPWVPKKCLYGLDDRCLDWRVVSIEDVVEK